MPAFLFCCLTISTLWKHHVPPRLPEATSETSPGSGPPRPQQNPATSPPTWNVLVLVFLQVPVQVGLLPKAAVTQVALEWLLLVMDVSNVPLEVGGNAE